VLLALFARADGSTRTYQPCRIFLKQMLLHAMVAFLAPIGMLTDACKSA